MSNWIGPPKRLIVTAACRVNGIVFVGVRHFDKIMIAQMSASKLNRHETTGHVEQGFIDNQYNFLDRREALKVATEAGQINQHRTKTSPEDELFSEDLH